MATRTFNLSADITPDTVSVDLAPRFTGMPLSRQELEVFRGDDATIKFAITQNGQAFDLTDYTVKYQAKAAIGDSSFVFDKTATVTDAAGGLAEVSLSGTDLETDQTLTAQLYLTQSGTTQTVFQSPLVVLPSV